MDSTLAVNYFYNYHDLPVEASFLGIQWAGGGGGGGGGGKRSRQPTMKY